MEYPDISKFPPRLQKLAKFISDSTEYKVNLSDYCREAGFSYDSVRHGICKAKEKGHDFNALVDKIHHEKLTSFKPRIYKALIEEGEKGNCKAIEIFFRLTGDLSPVKAEQSTTITSLTYVLAMPSTIPQAELEDALESHEHPGNGVGPGSALGPGFDPD